MAPDALDPAPPRRRTLPPPLPPALSRIDAAPAPRFQRRFGVRVFLYILALAIVSSTASTMIFYWRQRDFMNAQLQRRAQSIVKSLAVEAELGAYAGDAALCMVPIRHAITEDDVVFAAIYDHHGREILHAPPGLTLPPPPAELFRRLSLPPDQLPTTFPGMRAPDDTYHELYAPILTVSRDPALALFAAGTPAPQEVVGLARIGLSKHFAQKQLSDMLQRGLMLGAAVLAMGIVAAAVISRRVSRPIRALIEGAEALRAGQLDARVQVAVDDELGQLAYAFNRMAARLDESIGALENLNRGLEAEVARRTAEVQRAADFAALLNAPLGRGDVLPDYEPATAVVGGSAKGGLAALLDQSLEALIHATAARGAGVWLVPDGDVRGAPRTLQLARYHHTGPDQLQPAPSFARLEKNVPWSEGARLVAPLLLGTEVLGAVTLLEVRAREDLQRFVAQASAQLAIAVANVRAYAAADRLASALKERNAALARHRDQLQEMNRLKSEFLANISHELRTPLNAIIGYTELIADGIYGDVSPETRTALAGIDESGRGLLALINQILDLAKVESGKMSVQLEEVDVVQIAHVVVTEAAALAKDRPYHVGQSGESELRLRTDAAKVKQILTNLVSNAVKFTAEGHVELTVRRAPDGGCSVAVADTGIGIRPQDMKIIFEEFRQVDGSYTREFGGTGLGLAIARKFAVLLGGSIDVQSKVGVGSTFTLRLPREPQIVVPRPPRTTLESIAAAAVPVKGGSPT